MKEKPLHYARPSGGFKARVTICGMPVDRRRYVGPWNRDESQKDAWIGDITCQACAARLRAEMRGEPMPEPAPMPEGQPDEGQPEPAPAPVPKAPITGLEGLGTLGDLIGGFVERRARELAREEAAKVVRDAGPIQIEWKINDAPFAKIEGKAHKALPRILKLYAAGFRNFLIVGPAGSGKTTLAANLAAALSRTFGAVSCTSGMSETALTGRGIPNLATGKTEFQSTEFVACYESGGVFLIDEVDAADPNVMLVINSALANGHLPLPNRTDAPQATRHADSVVICAANTWGTGADRQYVGRNQLDAASLDRFVGATIEVDYDRELESALAGDPHICARVWEIRSKVEANKIRRVVGTRFLLAVVRLVKAAEEPVEKAIAACAMGWTPDERTKAGIKAA